MSTNVVPRSDKDGKLGLDDRRWEVLYAYKVHGELWITEYNSIDDIEHEDLVAIYDQDADETKSSTFNNFWVNAIKGNPLLDTASPDDLIVIYDQDADEIKRSTIESFKKSVIYGHPVINKIDASDLLPFYDTSEDELKNITFLNLFKGNEQNTQLDSADFFAVNDTSEGTIKKVTFEDLVKNNEVMESPAYNDLLLIYDRDAKKVKDVSIETLRKFLTASNWELITENADMEVDKGYLVDTRAVPVTLRLPSNPVTGSSVSIKEIKGNAQINNITIDSMGHKIEGESENYIIYTNYQGMQLVYSDEDTGWIRVYESHGAATYR